MRTRIFFITDIHGSTLCFKKFLNAHSVYKADVLILGGDITGKALVPIIERSDGKYSFHFAGKDIIADGKELETLKRRIEDSGQYFLLEARMRLEVSQKTKKHLNIFLTA